MTMPRTTERQLPSDETIGDHVRRRLAGVRCFQLFVLTVDKHGSIYASAKCLDAKNRVVEVRTTAPDIGAALAQLFVNADLATAPEESAT